MINQTLGHYRIVAQLGSGGMGVVYRARDLRLDRDVALKVLPPGTLSDEATRKQFRKEALALAKLNHPNIETVHEFDTQDNVDFLVMELIEGATLADRLRNGPMPEKDVLAFGAQLAAGLEEAHEHGVVHRDLKPGNIFVTPKGLVKVLDFGLARFQQREKAPDLTASLTAVHPLAGTLPYMAPEQLRGEPADQRSDIYAAGTVLYEMATGVRPFRYELATRLADSILHQPPPSPCAVNPRVSAPLESIILKCLDKEPESRYQSAKELEVDLRRVARDSTSTRVAITSSGNVALVARPPSNRRLTIVAALVVLLALAAIASWWAFSPQGPRTAHAAQTTVAVLPFQNLGAGADADYLRFALADQIATTLSYASALAVRPSTMTQKYAERDIDVQVAGRALRVANIVTGHFLQQGGHIQMSLELIDVEGNRVLWRDTVDAPADDHIGLEAQLAARVRQGVATRLGAASTGSAAGRTQPKNPQAYDLYLHAIALPHDPAPNKQAISLLEQSVALDSGYAPAWSALGSRYNYDAQYSTGGDEAFRRTEADLGRALALDPDLVDAATGLAGSHVENGKMNAAFEEAKATVTRRPDSAIAHFTLSYVLRYASLLDESVRECDLALALDPTDYRLRSCAFSFIYLNRPERALDFIRVDSGSEWSNRAGGMIFLEQGKIDEAMTYFQKIPADSWLSPQLIIACMMHRPAGEIDRLNRESQAALASVRDGEYIYNTTTDLVFCGKRMEALQNLHRAIDHNFCAVQAADTDPRYASLRSMPEFSAFRDAAMECRKKFLTQRDAQIH